MPHRKFKRAAEHAGMQSYYLERKEPHRENEIECPRVVAFQSVQGCQSTVSLRDCSSRNDSQVTLSKRSSSGHKRLAACVKSLPFLLSHWWMPTTIKSPPSTNFKQIIYLDKQLGPNHQMPDKSQATIVSSAHINPGSPHPSPHSIDTPRLGGVTPL
jgi:hypothetical protein